MTYRYDIQKEYPHEAVLHGPIVSFNTFDEACDKIHVSVFGDELRDLVDELPDEIEYLSFQVSLTELVEDLLDDFLDGIDEDGESVLRDFAKSLRAAADRLEAAIR